MSTSDGNPRERSREAQEPPPDSQALKRTGTDSGKQRSKPKTKRSPYRSPRRRLFTAVLKIVAVSYAAILAFLVLMESRLVYPGAYMDASPAGQELTASLIPTSPANASPARPATAPQMQSVQYPSTDGITLTGQLLERGPNKPILLYFHGNGIQAKSFGGWMQKWSRLLDANVMAAEYRGFEDDHTPTEKGVISDSLAARDYLCDRYGAEPSDIMIWGTSLGGGCAVAVASNGGAKALVLERTFDRLIDVAAEKYPYIPVKWLIKNRYDSLARLTVYHGPLIMIHGTADNLIPIEHGRRLYESNRCEPKQWIEVEGMNHFVSLPTQIESQIAESLQELIKSEPQEDPEASPPEAAASRVNS